MLRWNHDDETIPQAGARIYPQPYTQVWMRIVDYRSATLPGVRDPRSPVTPYHGTVDEDITSALQRRVSDMEDGAEVVVTAWVSVVEYINADGGQELALIHDTESPDWRIDGLLSGGFTLIGWDETADEWDSD